MVYSIKVTHPDNKIFWRKQPTEEEFHAVNNYCINCNSASVISATLKPIRTDNLKNFAKDFFLPTFFNQAIHVDNTAGKIFAILGSLVLDTITFPIRVITCIPRAISNAKREEHPLHKYLREEEADEAILSSDWVKLKFGWLNNEEMKPCFDRRIVLLKEFPGRERIL